MSLVTANGAQVIDLRLCMPRCGAWHADLSVDDATGLSGDVELLLGDALQLKGTVRRGGVDADVGVYRIVGGKGGLPTTTAAKSYRQTTARIVASDILTDAGETLSSTSDTSLLARQLSAWVKFQTPSHRALGQLLDELDAAAGFRVLPHGTVWVGLESWPQSHVSPEAITRRDERLGVVSVQATESALVLPGETFDGRRVSYVEYSTLEGRNISGEVWFE